MELPPALEQAWHARGYYGSVSHNVKAVYQRYLGWYDGNPAHLWEHPPVARAERYVAAMGGPEAVLATARAAHDDGDLRWACEVLSHLVFAAPDHSEGRALLADTFEQLGFGAENGTWRCAYLSGARELREGGFGTPISPVADDVLAALTPAQLFDAMAVRVNGPRCWLEHLTIDLDLGDETHRLRLANGVLTHSVAPQPTPPDLTLRLPRTALPLLAAGPLTAETLAGFGIEADGDLTVAARLAAALDAPDPDFAIVTP